MATTKSMSLRKDVFEALIEIQKKLSAEFGFKVSAADAVQFLINHYEKTNGK